MVTLHLVAVLAVGVPCDSRGEGCEELASRGWWGTWVVVVNVDVNDGCVNGIVNEDGE